MRNDGECQLEFVLYIRGFWFSFSRVELHVRVARGAENYVNNTVPMYGVWTAAITVLFAGVDIYFKQKCGVRPILCEVYVKAKHENSSRLMLQAGFWYCPREQLRSYRIRRYRRFFTSSIPVRLLQNSFFFLEIL
jgi:hypothetical protein